MGQKLRKIALFILLMAVLSGCSSTKLSEDYDEARLRDAAEAVINDMNEGDYKGVLENSDETLKSAIDEKKLDEAWNSFRNRGEYESISKMTFSEKDGYAVVTAIADYEEGKVQFTLSYNKEMELAGIWMK